MYHGSSNNYNSLGFIFLFGLWFYISVNSYGHVDIQLTLPYFFLGKPD